MSSARPHSLIAGCLVALVIVCGCSTQAAESEGDARSDGLAQSDSEPQPQLPPGHPPPSSPESFTVDAPPAGSGSGSDALVWSAPESWQSVEPSSSMRRAQYRVSGPDGDAECVIFYFGPGQGGDAQANVLRWADQFGQPDGRSSRDVLQTEELQVGDVSVLLAEVTGIYSGGMASMGGPREQLSGYMLLGAVAQGPDANWFFKFTGPEGTVEANRELFLGMIKSLGKGGAQA